MVQVDSGATEGLQLVDVLSGAVAFGFKADCGIASHTSLKGSVSADLRTLIGVPDFNLGYSEGGFSVHLYEHTAWLVRQQAKLAGASLVTASSRPERVRTRSRGGRPQPSSDG